MVDFEKMQRDFLASGEKMDWNSLYENLPVESLPWYASELDKDLSAQLAQLGIDAGRFLDLGTGPGTQAIELAKLGFDVTGADISSASILKARVRAGELEHIKFVQDDILASKITESFDYIFDRGCFHVFESTCHAAYLASVARLLRKDGLLFLKCFAEGEPGEFGPKCYNAAMIEEIFAKKFKMMTHRSTTFPGNSASGSHFSMGHKALFVVMQKFI